MVSFLRDHGADVDANIRGTTALIEAVKGGQLQMVENLIEVDGANVNFAVPMLGKTALTVAGRYT